MAANDPLEEQQTKLVNQSRREESRACPDAEVIEYWRLLPRFLESGGLRSKTCFASGQAEQSAYSLPQCRARSSSAGMLRRLPL